MLITASENQVSIRYLSTIYQGKVVERLFFKIMETAFISWLYLWFLDWLVMPKIQIYFNPILTQQQQQKNRKES